MPHYSTYCGDSLNEYFFTVFTERYESLCDDEKDEKERMKKIAASWECVELEEFVTDTIQSFETVSKNFMSAILGSIDYDQLQKDLHGWLEEIELDEEDEKNDVIKAQGLPMPKEHLKEWLGASHPSDSTPCSGHSHPQENGQATLVESPV